MVRPGLEHLLIGLVVGVLGVSCAAAQEDTEFPSLRSSLGAKMAIADDYYDDEDGGEGEAPQVPAKPCCFPLVWQGGLSQELVVSASGGGGGAGRGGKSSGPRLSRSIDKFYVDGQNRRVAGHVMLLVHHCGKWSLARNFSWIYGAGSNRTGDLYLFDGKNCQHRAVSNVAWRRQCIPANATLHGGFILGPSQGGLNVQTWLFGGQSRSAPRIEGDTRPYPRPRVVYSVGVDVVPASCIPVLMEERGFIFRGIDQPTEPEDDLSGHANVHDTGLLDNDHDLKYENYVR